MDIKNNQKAVNKVVISSSTGDVVLLDLTDDSVTSETLLSGFTAHAKTGKKILGNMPNNGSINKTINGLNTTSVTIPNGYTAGGIISLSNDIETALSKI